MSGAVKPAADSRLLKQNTFIVLVNHAGIYAIVVLLLIIGGIIAPGKYFTVANFRSTIQAIALLGMVSVGMSFVTFSANYADMSAPMTIAFSGMITVTTLWMGFWPAVICGIATGTFMGLVNGIMVGKFRAHPIIWTMAFNFVISGIVRWIYGGTQVYPDRIAANNPRAVEIFNSLARSSLLGIPKMILVMILMFIAGQFILTRTKFGNQLKVTGSNYEVARLSGINVVRSIIYVYLINAVCCS
ncbi:MAG: ABC transporter permease, partial [Treponema sp.]|nr:ABC transporter permease [Treponema sp.]